MKGPGKSHREGISLVELIRRFPNDETAEAYFVQMRWPYGIACPYCGSMNVKTGAKHKTMPYRCREKECAKRFSTKSRSVMEASKLGFQTWALALFLMATNLKGISSMKLHRDLSINQRSAWFLAHRLRIALTEPSGPFSGPVEVDETFFGGKRSNMSNAKRKELNVPGKGGGAVGKATVVGVKDRKTGKVIAQVVDGPTSGNLKGFVYAVTMQGATVYTDDAKVYKSLEGVTHKAVKHNAKQYVDGQAHTNGIESFWSMLKCAHMGTFHKLSPKHLNRYVSEFAGRHNMRDYDTTDQMARIALGMDKKRLKYKDLIASNGLDSTARLKA